MALAKRLWSVVMCSMEMRRTVRGTAGTQVLGNRKRNILEPRFGRVLSLPAATADTSNSDDALKGLDTVSITGWVLLRSDQPVKIFDLPTILRKLFARQSEADDGFARASRLQVGMRNRGRWQSALPPMSASLAVVLDAAATPSICRRTESGAGHKCKSGILNGCWITSGAKSSLPRQNPNSSTPISTRRF